MFNLGLKLWSINENYIEEAKNLYSSGIYSYIELYVLPDSINYLDKWAKLKIPFNIHAPHYRHNVNLAKAEYENFNRKCFEEVKLFAEELNANHIVVHGGMDGNIDEVIRQLNIVKTPNMLIENKPYRVLPDSPPFCRGASIEEIKKICQNTNLGFCLDIGHALCYANSIKIDPYKYLEAFNKLKPRCYHLSDGDIHSEIDMHLNFGNGNYDFAKIFDIIKKNRPIAIETKKQSEKNLNDFVKDVKWLNKLY